MAAVADDAGVPKEALRMLNSVVDFVVAELNHKVFKDECMYCFHSPYSPGGLFVCLRTFVGLCNRHIHEYVKNMNAKVFLNIKKRKVPTVEPEEPKDKVQKLIIRADKEENVEEFYLIVYPNLDNSIELTSGTIGEDLYRACRSVIDHISATMQDRLQAGVSEWDGEARTPLNRDEVLQLDIGEKKIPYHGWVCEEPDCGLTENLWLNLTDGKIMCGRGQMISENVRSKGNGHAKLHYERTGYPVVVKLGTIVNGDADVYSYMADDSVYDPELEKHLKHFGLDINKFEKTEKSTLELELDMNQQWEWTRCQEAGVTLENVFGPGFTGLINIGSSCYINSVLQVLLLTPEFVEAYGKRSEEIFQSVASAAHTHDDFNCQLAKVVNCLLSGDYAQAESEATNGIKPTQFRRVAGKGHVEFSTAKQQDAEEYIRHLFEKIDSNIIGHVNPVNAFRYKVVKRFQDVDSKRVRYTTNEDILLSLPVPMDKAVQTREDAENGPKDRKIVSLLSCLEMAFGDEIIEDFTSPITGNKQGATQHNRMGSFPDFLIVQVRRFTVAEDWTIKKLDVDVLVDEEVDLNRFRDKGPAPGEEFLPDDAATAASQGPPLDQNIIDSLTAMGFSLAASRKATYLTKNTGLEAAAEWVMSHLGDPDIDEEHLDLNPRSSAASAPTSNESNSELVSFLTALGFTSHQAKYGLKMARGDANAAAEWLFTNADSVPAEEMDTSAPTRNLAPKITRDGNGRYKLRAFISHMGRSPHSGHYVSHVKKDDKWYLFNDEKVAISQNPPISLGYIYLFERI